MNVNQINNGNIILPLSLLLLICSLIGVIGIFMSASLPLLAAIWVFCITCFLVVIKPAVLLIIYFAIVILIPDLLYINIGFVYLTEGVIFLFIIYIVISGRINEIFSYIRFNRFMSILFAMLILAGIISFVRGFNYGLVAARDAATIFYCIITFLAVGVLRTEDDIKYLFTLFIFIDIVFNILIFLNVATGQLASTEFGAPRIFGARSSGFLFLCGCIAVSNVFDIKSPLGRTLLRIFGLGQFGMLFLLSGTRNVWIAAVISLAFWFIFSQKRVKLKWALFYLSVIILVGVMMTSIVKTKAGGSFINGLVMSIESIFDYKKSANATGRLDRWRWGVESVLDYNPVFGKPFGSPTLFFKYSDRYETELKMGFHNSYITLLYYTGLLGFSAILLLLLYFLSVGVKLSRYRVSTTGKLAEVATVSFVFYAIIAAFNVILEGPQSATFFWLLPGILLVLQKVSLRNESIPG